MDKLHRSVSIDKVSKLMALIICLLLPSHSFARDREKNFSKGRGGHQRGNEHSQRPGRVPVGAPTSGGNGCPAGTMRVVFAPDNLSFAILFDQFVASAQITGGDRRDVMTCDALIPIELPPNMQMEITRVDYRGFISLPDAAARAKLHALYNFRGRGGDRDRMNLRFDFRGPVQDNYVITTDLLNGGSSTPNPESSPCGGPTQLRVYNQLTVSSRTTNAQAQATIDSIDGQSNAIYHINWRQCTSSSSPATSNDNDNDNDNDNHGNRRNSDDDENGRDNDRRGGGGRNNNGRDSGRSR